MRGFPRQLQPAFKILVERDAIRQKIVDPVVAFPCHLIDNLGFADAAAGQQRVVTVPFNRILF